MQFWNTWTGTITDQKQITIPETQNPRGPARIELPEITHDLALKLVRR